MIGSTSFGTLINDAVSDGGLGGGSGTGTVSGSGYFPATNDRSSGRRQVWRYTFTLAARSNLRIETGWDYRVEYNCLPGTFPCGSDAANQIETTFTSGVDLVTIDLTPAGGSTRRYDPLASFQPGPLDDFVNGEGFFQYSYDRSRSLALQPGDYTLDFTGYGAPGGPAFPDSGGGLQTVDLEAVAVPEPSTWAMMIGGMTLSGLALRRRQTFIRG